MQPSPWDEQVLAAVLESVEEAIVGIALDGSIELWSRGAEHLYGYTADEVKGQSFLSLLPIYEVPLLQAALAKACDEKMTGYEMVERLHKTGPRVSVTVRRTALKDDRGAVIGILESGRAEWQNTQDISSGPQLRLLVEQIPVLLWTTDLCLRITSNWGSDLEHSEIHAGELVGRTVSEYLKCKNSNMAPMAHHYAALRGESVRFEYKRQNRVLDIHLGPCARRPEKSLGASVLAPMLHNESEVRSRSVIRRRMTR